MSTGVVPAKEQVCVPLSAVPILLAALLTLVVALLAARWSVARAAAAVSAMAEVTPGAALLTAVMARLTPHTLGPFGQVHVHVRGSSRV